MNHLKFISQYKRTTIALISIFLFAMALYINSQKDYLGYQKNSDQQSGQSGQEVAKNGLKKQINVKEVVNKDDDGDGIQNWEESLWGTDPKKKDSNDDGINDYQEISERKSKISPDKLNQVEKNGPTQTEQLAKELLVISSTLSQSGNVNQENIDKLSTVLAEKIANPVIRKTYLESDLKITGNESVEVEKYRKNLYNLKDKYKIYGNINETLKKFVETDDVNVLSELTETIKSIRVIIDEMIKISVPSNIARSHLSVINAYEKMMENLSDLQLVDIDPIVSMGAIVKYPENVQELGTSEEELLEFLNGKR